MERKAVLRKLAALRPWLEARGVTRVLLVGSHARDMADAGSDIDLLVEFDKMPGLGFFAIERELSEQLGAPVELILEGGLNPVVRARMLADAVDA
jgi:uncharacterized protein